MLTALDPFELIPGFLSNDESEALLAVLLAQATWREEYLQMFGREVRSPRQVCWYGDAGVGYRYSGGEHRATGWLPALAALRDRLQHSAHSSFNFALLNRYNDHNDAMGWHADDEPELGDAPVIASLSLGATRTMLVRRKAKTPGVRRTSRSLELEHGSLLLMRGVSQSNFQHSIPRRRAACGVRVNLTFRHVLAASPANSLSC